jgi:D-alanine transaminase
LLEKDNQKVYVNGEFYSKKEASISVFDRGFLFSDSVYEVSAVIEGKLVDWKEHFARLIRSLSHLSLENNFKEEDFYQIQKKLIKENELKEGLCYIQVTRGVAEREFNFAKKSLLPTVVIFTQEKQILNNPASKVGIKIITVPDDRWRRRDIKTTQLLAQSLAKTHAIHKGVDDSLLVQGGFINEGSSSNAFIIKDKHIITPSLSNDILGGITRSSVIKFCQINNIEIKEQKIKIDDLMNAQEVFLTSATGFVLPVIEVNGRRVGNGLVGDMVKKIQRIYIEQIKAKLS